MEKKTDTYEQIIMDFIKQRFGLVVGRMLFEERLVKKKIKSFKELEQKAKVRFTEGLLHQILDKFLTKQEIDATLLQLNLRFSVLKSVDKVTMLLNQKVTMQPFEVKFETNSDAKLILEKLRDNAVCFPVTLTGLLDAKALFFLTKENALTLAQLMISLLGMGSSGDQLDEMKESSIREFINILVPAVLDSISDTLNAKINFQSQELHFADMVKYVDSMIKQIEAPTKDQKPISKIFMTESNMIIGDEHVDFVVVVFMESESAALSSAFDSSNIKKDSIFEEEQLQKIQVNLQMDKKLAMIQILNQFKVNGPSVINETLAVTGLKSLDNITDDQKQEFIDNLIKKHFSSHSSNIIKFLQGSCSRILQLENSMLGNIDFGEKKVDNSKKEKDSTMIKMLKKKEEPDKKGSGEKGA